MIPSSRKRRSAREIKKELRAIYTGKDGSVPNLTQLEHRKQTPLTGVLIKIILVLLTLSVIAWSGFFLLSKGLLQEKETLGVSIETKEVVRSGEETTMTIRYENTGRVPIAALELKLNLPETFHLTSSIPPATSGTQWTIGSLTPSSDGAITLSGIFLSEVPSSQRVQALFTYKPANFNSDFQKIENKIIQLNASTLQLSMTGPEKALAGDPVEYVINVQHNGNKPVYNVRVVPLFPLDFTLQESKPKLNEQQLAWEIASLEPGKLFSITLKGTFTSTASGALAMGAKTGFLDEENFFEQTHAEVKTDVLGGAVSFHLIIDGTDKSQSVDAGKTLHGSIDYKNPGKDSVEDVVFTLTLESAGKLPVDLTQANFSEGVRTEKVIVWNKENLQPLAKLASNAEGLIDFTLPLVSDLLDYADTFTVKLTMAVGRVGTIKTSHTIESTPIVFTLNSDTTLSAQARYFAKNGTVIGSGELPPRVEKTTTYHLEWNLSNSLHELTTVQIETTLPPDVSWKEAVTKDIGTLTYNPITRRVKWQIEKLPIDIKQAQAGFDVSVTPKKTDVGKFMKLTDQTTLQAIDSVTKGEIHATRPVITSELTEDLKAIGKGVVVE